MKSGIRAVGYTAAVLCMSLALFGCSGESAKNKEEVLQESVETVYLSADGMFSDDDLCVEYTDACEILLSDGNITCLDKNTLITGSTVTVKNAGTYIVRGSLSDGRIIVDAKMTDKIHLVLDGVEIKNSSTAPLYIRQGDKVIVTLADGSENFLSVSGEYVAIDDSNIDAVIFSKEDLTLNGNGSLVINAEFGHGIVSKDELAVCDANINVTAQCHALSGKDCVKISGGTLTLSSGKDGIHAENTDSDGKGYVYIGGGKFSVSSDGDGISASDALQIYDGIFDIKSGGGAENAETKAEDSFNGRGMHAVSSQESVSDTVSCKGIKSAKCVVIRGGEFSIDAADDAIHSNGNAEINSGEYTLSSGDDGIHADYNVLINGGNIKITESYEGIEGLTVDINDGNIELYASDDGINAAGGNDMSDRDGHFGFEKTESNGIYIKITGGYIKIDADGDGIDSNGCLLVTGGEVYVEGPENGGNGALDYESYAEITGGTVMAIGVSEMSEGFGDSSTQGAMLVNFSGNASGGEIKLSDSEGNVIFTYSPKKSYNSVVISCDKIVKGETYTLSACGQTQEIEMTDTVYNSSNGGFGGFDGKKPESGGAGELPPDGDVRRENGFDAQNPPNAPQDRKDGFGGKAPPNGMDDKKRMA